MANQSQKEDEFFQPPSFILPPEIKDFLEIWKEYYKEKTQHYKNLNEQYIIMKRKDHPLFKSFRNQ